jgi:regulator of sigma E protease
MPEILNTIFYFLIVIGILVFIHEFGHFIAARLTGMRAEVFALGMGFRIFGFNRVTGFSFGKLKEGTELGNHTDYRVCAFPIGGYVKVSGMIDESLDKDFIQQEPKPWEYRSKPVWKRMIVITAGVIMNIFLAYMIFYFFNIFKGRPLHEITSIGYVEKGTIAFESGFLPDDKILSINNTELKYWEDLSKLFIENLGEPLTFIIKRNGNDIVIKIPKEKLTNITDKDFGIVYDNNTVQIENVFQGKPAELAGLKNSDVVKSINGTPIVAQQQLVELIKSNANKNVEIKWIRNENVMSTNVIVSADSTIGIEITSRYEGPVKIQTFNAITAITVAGTDMYYYGVEMFFKSIVKIVKGDIPFKKAIGGPIKIAQVSAQSAERGFFTFIYFVALLSISLAVINILPFPALDGGHFIILIYEAIFRKPVPYKVQDILQKVGFIILLAFMLFVLYNDIIALK